MKGNEKLVSCSEDLECEIVKRAIKQAEQRGFANGYQMGLDKSRRHLEITAADIIFWCAYREGKANGIDAVEAALNKQHPARLPECGGKERPCNYCLEAREAIAAAKKVR